MADITGSEGGGGRAARLAAATEGAIEAVAAAGPGLELSAACEALTGEPWALRAVRYPDWPSVTLHGAPAEVRLWLAIGLRAGFEFGRGEPAPIEVGRWRELQGLLDAERQRVAVLEQSLTTERAALDRADGARRELDAALARSADTCTRALVERDEARADVRRLEGLLWARHPVLEAALKHVDRVTNVRVDELPVDEIAVEPVAVAADDPLLGAARRLVDEFHGGRLDENVEALAAEVRASDERHARGVAEHEARWAREAAREAWGETSSVRVESVYCGPVADTYSAAALLLEERDRRAAAMKSRIKRDVVEELVARERARPPRKPLIDRILGRVCRLEARQGRLAERVKRLEELAPRVVDDFTPGPGAPVGWVGHVRGGQVQAVTPPPPAGTFSEDETGRCDACLAAIATPGMVWFDGKPGYVLGLLLETCPVCNPRGVSP